MIVLKWYSIIMMVLGLIANIYESGKKEDGLMAFLTILLDLPIIIFLILA